MMGGSTGDSTATIEILLSKGSNPERKAADLQERIDAAGIDGLIAVSAMESGMGGFTSGEYMAYIKGDDYARVLQAADELTASLEGVDGLSDIKADVATTLPTPIIEIDEDKLAFHISQGLDTNYFMAELTSLMNGTGTGITLDGRELYVTSATRSATSAEQLGGLIINSGGLDYPIELVHVADVAIVEQPTSIKRIDQYRAATVTATITEKDVGAVNQAAQAEMDKLDGTGVDIEMGGVAEEMEETFRNMGIAIMVAIGISFAIVVISFRSLLNALIIMVSLPLAAVGALLGLLIAGYPLGASAMMGVLMLVGIVLTNAIVLLALVDQLRKKGMTTYDALVQGGRTRLRPILMTALTTMIALVPIAVGLGEGVLLAAELAIVVLGGLFTSTLLTLVVIPVLYSLTDRIRRRAPVKADSGGPRAG